MKNKIMWIFIIIILILAFGVYWFFFDMIKLPTGEFISEVQSPNGSYTVKAYRTNGGATTAYDIRGELNFNNSRKRPKNIYWNYREEKANIEWINDDTVSINGHELQVPNERYDFRREK